MHNAAETERNKSLTEKETESVELMWVFGDNWRIIFGMAILKSTHNVCFYGEISKLIP